MIKCSIYGPALSSEIILFEITHFIKATPLFNQHENEIYVYLFHPPQFLKFTRKNSHKAKRQPKMAASIYFHGIIFYTLNLKCIISPS